MWVQLNKAGSYDIACDEMCGTYHYRMQAYLTVYNEEDFAYWLAEAQGSAEIENDLDNPDLYWGWQWVTQK
jgi:cytochrome c oxidase subunit 2